jgi:hypothetical protein
MFFTDREPSATVARLEGRFFEFEGGEIVARTEEWSSLRRSDDGPSGYSSYKGEIIPVYDLARLAGSGQCHGGELAILKTVGGYIAILADGVHAAYRGTRAAVDVRSIVCWSPSYTLK